MLLGSLANPRRKGFIRLVALVLAILGLGATIAERSRSSVSAELAAARIQHRQLLLRQELLGREAEALREQLAERSRATAAAGNPTIQPRPRA